MQGLQFYTKNYADFIGYDDSACYSAGYALDTDSDDFWDKYVELGFVFKEYEGTQTALLKSVASKDIALGPAAAVGEDGEYRVVVDYKHAKTKWLGSQASFYGTEGAANAIALYYMTEKCDSKEKDDYCTSQEKVDASYAHS